VAVVSSSGRGCLVVAFRNLCFVHITIFRNRKILIEPTPSITNMWTFCKNSNGLGGRQRNNLHLVLLEICKTKKGFCFLNLSFNYNKALSSSFNAHLTPSDTGSGCSQVFSFRCSSFILVGLRLNTTIT